MLQFIESKADAHSEAISVLLRHAQRHSGEFLFWMLSLELHKTTFGYQNYAYVAIQSKQSGCD